MPKMTAMDAAVHILKNEGVELVFGVPGAAILPLYDAMRKDGGIKHVLVRHEEGGTHAALSLPALVNFPHFPLLLPL